jgi:polyisoprenoid-binding protein YceI
MSTGAFPMQSRSLARAAFAAAAALLAASPAFAAGLTYRMDPDHTVVLATWSHFGYSHPSANFPGATGTIVYDADAPEQSSVEVAVPISRIDTFVPKLDEHLKGPGFLDAARYPQATFRSTSVKTMGKDRLAVTGDLTLHGVTRPLVLDVVLNKAAPHPMGKTPMVGFDATATLKRSEFGVDAMLPMVADEVALRITTEAGAESAK